MDTNSERARQEKHVELGDVISLSVEQILKLERASPNLKNAEPALAATDRFVVERAVKDGGGTGMGPHDVYPDGHHVTARRLKDQRTYDPDGLAIDFYQSGCFINEIGAVSKLGKMKLTFL
jgi:hypothetical protein